MSVYSGFATRAQETSYNQLVQTLILTLKKRVVKFYRQQPCDQQKFTLLIHKLYKKLVQCETHKYLNPKYGALLGELVDVLGITVNWDSSSTSSFLRGSNLSFKQQLRRERGETANRQQPRVEVVNRTSLTQLANTKAEDFSLDLQRVGRVKHIGGKTHYNGPLQTINERESQTVQRSRERIGKKFYFLELLRKKVEQPQPEEPVQSLFQKQQRKLQLKQPIQSKERQKLEIRSKLFQRRIRAASQLQNPDRPDLLQPLIDRRSRVMPKLEDYLPGAGEVRGREKSGSSDQRGAMRSTVRWRRKMFVQNSELQEQQL